MPWTKTEIQQFYDSYAKSYDSESSLEAYPSPTILSCWLLESLQIQHQNATKSNPKQLNVIDVGCGTGQSSSIFFAQSLASDQEQTLQYKVTGVDASVNVMLPNHVLFNFFSCARCLKSLKNIPSKPCLI